MRRRVGAAGRSVSLSDTVGFIRDLPHGLIDAFQATLQEAADADLLLHVVDAANPHHPEQIDEVQRVLHEIGAAQRAAAAGVQQDRRPGARRSSRRQPATCSRWRACRCRACSSAPHTGAGLPELRARAGARSASATATRAGTADARIHETSA